MLIALFDVSWGLDLLHMLSLSVPTILLWGLVSYFCIVQMTKLAQRGSCLSGDHPGIK